MALEIDYNEVLDFGEEAAKSVDEKMRILKFGYNWIDVVEESEKQETKIAGKTPRDPQKILKRMHQKRMREIEDKRTHKQLLNQVHEELLKIFNAKRKEQEKRDPQKILKHKHNILMKNIETKQQTNALIPGAHRQMLERNEAKKMHAGLLKNVHNELMNLVKREEKTSSTEKRTLSRALKVLADKERQLIERIFRCVQWF